MKSMNDMNLKAKDIRKNRRPKKKKLQNQFINKNEQRTQGVPYKSKYE